MSNGVTALAVVRLLEAAAFAVLAALALRRAVGRDPTARWLAATFATLGAVTVFGVFFPQDAAGNSTAPAPVTKVLVVVLLLFPYFLFRFSVSLRGGTKLEVPAAAATLGMIFWTLLLPSVSNDMRETAAGRAYIAGLLALWTLLSMFVVWWLWDAGRAQPSVARRRMRLLALGAAALNVGLLVSGVGGSGDPTVDTPVHLLLLTSAACFYLGFAPPPVLRALWRRAGQRAVDAASSRVIVGTSREDVLAFVLPSATKLMGGSGSVFVGPDGRVEDAHQITVDQAAGMAAVAASVDGIQPRHAGGVLVLPLTSGRLLISVSRYAPFFGDEELDTLNGFATFVEVALERARLYEDERSARRDAEAATTELETFVATASHDLKAPLVSILAFADLLAESSLDDESRRYVERISANGLYMRDLVTAMLELARVGTVPVREAEVDLHALVEEIASEIRESHPGSTLEVGDLPVLWMDPMQARRLVTNLVVNAFEHGGAGRDAHVRVASWTSRDGIVSLSFADDGPGVPPEFRERAFEPFRRYGASDSGSRSGTGVGLAVCKKIIERAGGRIWFADVPRGADARIELPSAAMRGHAAARVKV